jgi:lipid-A-disaccharide synthase
VVTSVLVVAGEASGDAHGALVVEALKRVHPDVSFFGMGGPKLKAAGVELIHGAHEISVMGLIEVVPKIPRILTVMSDLVTAAKQRKPSVALLIDVPDFNLRLAKRLKSLGVPVVGYVAPMVWAWRAGRTKTISRLIDEVCCILPFEERFLRERGVRATYVGSPVLEQLPAPHTEGDARRRLGLAADRDVLAVLPGSRRSEITRLAKVMRAVSVNMKARHPGLQLVIPVAPGLSKTFVQSAFGEFEATYLDGNAALAVAASTVSLVASGTATLEAALMRRPFVTIYRMSWVSYAVGKALVRVPFFCLANLLAERKVVPELLQGAAHPQAIVAELERLWSGPERQACLEGLDSVRAKLGPPGASVRVAERLSGYLTA